MVKVITKYEPGMERFLIKPGSIDETLDYNAIFGSERSVEVEVGVGKGRFILAERLRRPNVNFLGIERSLKWLRVALFRAAKSPSDNVAFLCLDADLVIKLLIKPRSVAVYHVYFPDPWPKERHQKRRLFNPRLLEKMAETLVHQGLLLLKTDHAAYYEEAKGRILDSGVFNMIGETLSDEIIEDIEDIPENATHYEIKFRQEARRIHSGVFQTTV